MDFDAFTIGLLLTGDNPPALSQSELDSVQDAHLAHLAGLHASGDLFVAGPVPGPPEQPLRGLSVLRGGVDEAGALANRDPGVGAGVWRHEHYTWLVPRGVMAFTPGRLPRSMVEAAEGAVPPSGGAATVALAFDSYVRASTASVWQALTAPELVPQWRFGMSFQTSWSPGSPLASTSPDGSGVVVESDPRHVLAYDWTADDPSVNGGRASTVRFELGSLADTTRLRVRHDGLLEGSSFLAVVTEGWPMMLASLKSLLETGSGLEFR
jgi:uncharacterized protein YndB with AHSA1/START domain/uncharacterized protein YciI